MKNLKTKLNYLLQFVNDCDEEFIELVNTEIDRLNQEEIKLCATNPYYFYTNYVTFDGKPATTGYTEEEFNKQF